MSSDIAVMTDSNRTSVVLIPIRSRMTVATVMRRVRSCSPRHICNIWLLLHLDLSSKQKFHIHYVFHAHRQTAHTDFILCPSLRVSDNLFEGQCVGLVMREDLPFTRQINMFVFEASSPLN